MRQYVYNREEDRLRCAAENPCFFIATLKDAMTGKERELYLYTVTGIKERHFHLASTFAEASERVEKTRVIPKAEFDNWLCAGDSLPFCGKTIPASFVTRFLIAENRQSKEHSYGQDGDLSSYREQILNRDRNLLFQVMQSYELTQPCHNIIRIEEDSIENTASKQLEDADLCR